MFELSQLKDVIVIGVHGELDPYNVSEIDSLLTTVLQNNSGKVVLDFSDLHHLHFKLVPHLVDRVVELQCAGGDLKVAAGNPYINNILKAMGFEETFYPTVADAVLSFNPSEEEWN